MRNLTPIAGLRQCLTYLQERYEAEHVVLCCLTTMKEVVGQDLHCRCSALKGKPLKEVAGVCRTQLLLLGQRIEERIRCEANRERRRTGC